MAKSQTKRQKEEAILDAVETDPHIINLDAPVESRILSERPNFIRSDAEIRYYKDCYQRIKENGVNTKTIDTYALGMLALNMALVEESTLSIQSEGFMVGCHTERGLIYRRNPALDVLDKSQTAIKFYLKQFNMTPQARGKEYAAGGNDVIDDAFDQV